MESKGSLHPKVEVKQKTGNHESNHFNTICTFFLGIFTGT
jgi:hypothetical protein